MPVHEENDRPRIVVSRCLGFDACRYDGGIVICPPVARLAERAEVVTVCPEVGMGLGVPRDPLHLEEGPGGVRLVRTATGENLTDRMVAFAGPFLDRLGYVDAFVLKERSPSCGVRGTIVHRTGWRAGGSRGAGLFARMVMARFPALPVLSEMDLAEGDRSADLLTAFGIVPGAWNVVRDGRGARWIPPKGR